MRRPTLAAVVVVTLLTAGAIAVGCGGSNTSGNDDGSFGGGGGHGSDAGSGSDTSSGGDGAPDCSSSTINASDDPQCDSCAKANCCAEIQACEKSADCKALNDCLAKCASDDQTCVLTCEVVHEQGANVAQDLGACATDKCSNVCKAPDAGGFDLDAFGD